MLARSVIVAFAAFSLAALGFAQQRSQQKPTHANVAYGEHPNQRFDFYQAEVQKPAPLVIYIHGGGFRAGSKDRVSADLVKRFLAAGIHFASVEYRFIQHQKLPVAHYDSLRALQVMRSRAEKWKIDKARVAAFGGSAGAQICMWLAFHDEMAKPDSADPIERESSRLAYVATNGGQTTMHMPWWIESIPGYEEPHRPTGEYFGDVEGEELRAVTKEISALDLISADDPPIHMSYRMAPDQPIPPPDKNRSGWQVHHVNFGIALKEKADALGVEAHLAYPGKAPAHRSQIDFFLAKFGR